MDLDRSALQEFIMQPVSRDMVAHLAQQASLVIRCEAHVTAHHAHGQPTPPSTPPLDAGLPPLPSVEAFITSLVARSQVQVPTLMTSLVYLARLRARLPPVAKGMRCTVHRIFLASLILAAKNLNDSSPKNKHWARYTSVKGYEGFGFSLPEVNLMERQLLFLLDWDLRVEEADLLHHLEPFLTPIRQRYQLQEQLQEQHQREAILRQPRDWRRFHASADIIASRLRRQKIEARRMSTDPPARRRMPASPASSVSSASSSSQSASPGSLADSDRYRPYPPRRRAASPPSVQEVPRLSRADTLPSLSSRASSVAPSSRGATPASLRASSSITSMEEIHVLDGARSPSLSGGYPAMKPEELHASASAGGKKMRMSGYAPGGGHPLHQHTGFVARFLASATGSYMGGRRH
ncbi:cyclin [Aspergillus heteromorphus CBS 117.55]|uniref:Cyclin n=1 Tax=Aspergillus heteromorphus CBS 117.55 TaxID=1448321 RepID=A0A317W8E8_9EURO|nr:cyclin [Aspergillus heteromorphus CBS 117.55]PWY82896.1 cyclin [Aspergillus heteromorphus CBS 117.55]